MYFIFVLLIGLYLGYKLRSIVELLNYLKIKNYCKLLIERYEDSDYKIIRQVTNKEVKTK